MIEQHGFTIVAVEADWPDAAAFDRYVRGKPLRRGAEPPFRRFPVWMWRNTDVQDFLGWLRGYNAKLADPGDRTGFFGLDIYNMDASISAVIDYLQEVDPTAAETARERYSCMDRWRREPSRYGREALRRGFSPCEDAVVEILGDLLKRRLQYASEDWEGFLDAERNARLVASAERYYRVMYYGSAESWNLRDSHMFETLKYLVEASQRGGKAVVWAHNSHIGNALATEMGVVREELNLGQLCRERWGRGAALVGFGTHAGTVAAATDWDGEMEIKPVRPSRPGSVERLCHDAGKTRFLLDLRPDGREDLREALSEPRLERFIGVIYRPDTELMSHYSDVQLPQQFDAYVWFDETRAVTPLPTVRQESAPELEETWPFRL